MKKIIQRIFKKLGYEIIRYNRPSQLSINTILSLLEQRDLFFVEIGANDGKRKDPLYEFVRKHNIPGILVEPQKELFKKLKENYKEIDSKQILVNKAVGGKTGTSKMYFVEEHDGITSFDRGYVEKILKKNNKDWKIKEIEVETITLKNLLEQYKVKKIDIFQIDVEGYDYEIIKMIDFEKYKPKLIHYESKHLNRKDTVECENYLRIQGYSVLLNGSNTLAIYKD